MSEQFIFDSIKLEKGTDLKNIIKVPVVLCAEMVKYYSETDKYMFMPYSEIKDAIAWHKENMPRIPITIEHIRLFTDDQEVYIPREDQIIGFVSQLTTDDEKKVARGWAYITRSKVHKQLADALMRGHQIGGSVGGFAGGHGPGGFHDGQKYHGSHMKLKFHHYAMTIMSLPRCPTGICGFNVKDSETMMEFITREMPIFMKNGMKQSEAVATIITTYKNQMKYDKKIDISAEEPSTEFKDFHESLILNDLLSPKSCVLNFYKLYQDGIRASEIVVINKDEGQIDNHNTDFIKKSEAINLSENEVKILNEQINKLKNENDELKNKEFADAEKTIKDLQDANKEFADANEELKASVATLQTDVMAYKQEEIFKMQKTILDSKKFTPEQIKAMDLKTLESTYDIVKLFVDSAQGTVLRPTPANNFSTLPRPKAPEITDADPIPVRQYRLGQPPPMDVILNEKDPHWKPRYGKAGGN